MSARLTVHDIKVRWNSGLSGKACFTLHTLHAPLVRYVCPFIEATHIEHYRNIYLSTNNISYTEYADTLNLHIKRLLMLATSVVRRLLLRRFSKCIPLSTRT